MTKRKMIITHSIHESYIKDIQEAVPDWELIVGKEPHIWQDHLQDAEIIAGWKKGIAELLDGENLKLKWIQSWSAGVNYMPLSVLSSHNIKLTSAAGVHAYPISETIFALMLALTRKIDQYVKNQQQKKWHHADINLEIHGKTIGIFGFGAIGKETAKIAKAFGMHVIGVRFSGKSDPYADEMYTAQEIDEILLKCDYIAVTLPLTDETKHLFGAKQFSLMKPSSFFINIGRGEIADEQALIEALRDKKIAGAGLDVFEKEPLDENSPLWELDNVIITPHTAGSTEHYDQRLIRDIFLPNLKQYLAGEDPSINLVDYKKGY
ncbi:D-2-hydroxyacid dehydrogenase [Cytobacillus gottheilii]|uniref:D-2-hydroxyacid dehydrogenase n=1 Tax=Cytobacillus gottheilii TaxID=859144 RepID=UPI000836BFE4|nr:D-2-hydroxyacid dehydrogenase [Cytobacillus gottheilii]